MLLHAGSSGLSLQIWVYFGCHTATQPPVWIQIRPAVLLLGSVTSDLSY